MREPRRAPRSRPRPSPGPWQASAQAVLIPRPGCSLDERRTWGWLRAASSPSRTRWTARNPPVASQSGSSHSIAWRCPSASSWRSGRIRPCPSWGNAVWWVTSGQEATSRTGGQRTASPHPLQHLRWAGRGAGSRSERAATRACWTQWASPGGMPGSPWTALPSILAPCREVVCAWMACPPCPGPPPGSS